MGVRSAAAVRPYKGLPCKLRPWCSHPCARYRPVPQGRLQMELGALLGYGAAGASLALMWRLGLMDLLLPQHALYLRVRCGVLECLLCTCCPCAGTDDNCAAAAWSPTGQAYWRESCWLSTLTQLPACRTAALQRQRVPRAPRAGSSQRKPRRELLFDLAAELDRHVHPQVGGADASSTSVSTGCPDGCTACASLLWPSASVRGCPGGCSPEQLLTHWNVLGTASAKARLWRE
jgi:hypothetical protein